MTPLLIGMFHVRKNPEHVSRAYLYAAAAKLEGHDFVYFTSRGVDFDTQTIQGYYYEKGKWKQKTFPFPDVLINLVAPRTEKQRKVYNQLRKLIPYTSYNVGSKLDIYRKIEEGKAYIGHLIPYLKVEKTDDVLGFLELYPQAVLKPIVGHHGDDVYYLEKTPSYYVIRDEEGKESKLWENTIKPVLRKILKQRPMLIQKYIKCQTKDGRPYDIRLHLQKDGEGKWNLAFVQPKVGKHNRIITNVIKGGEVPPANRFFREQFGIRGDTIRRRLSEFALGFAEHFESQYEYFFDEIGIDVGLDDHEHIWIYEVNSRPGQSFLEGQTARRAIQYAVYIAKRKRGWMDETDTSS